MEQVGRGTLKTGCPLLRIDAADPDPYVVVWRVPEPDESGPRRIVGFVADASLVHDTFARIIENSPLLPPSLGGDTHALLSVRVAAGAGGALFESSPEWSEYTSEHVLEGELAALRIAVALQPQAAERLIIGGLPRDRLPLLGGLLVLTIALVGVGAVQLRREHELARLRADFISGVSHELRTPLAQIRMFGETLLLDRVRSAAERQRSLAIIVQEAQRLTQLIDNVLHFSRAERGTAVVSLTPARLDIMVREIVESFQPLARSRRASVAVRFHHGVVAPIDAGAFRQVMLNLLDNAVKYGPAGQTIRVEAWHQAGAARIAVEDQGPGVPAEHRARIWEPFYRIAARTNETGGTGIGLSIVKELVGRHGGRVWVEDGAEGAARFVVEIPGAAVAEQSQAWNPAAAGA
jgi:signal transduction histidine kinase